VATLLPPKFFQSFSRYQILTLSQLTLLAINNYAITAPQVNQRKTSNLNPLILPHPTHSLPNIPHEDDLARTHFTSTSTIPALPPNLSSKQTLTTIPPNKHRWAGERRHRIHKPDKRLLNHYEVRTGMPLEQWKAISSNTGASTPHSRVQTVPQQQHIS
jgi:hypothetical protein